MQAPLAAPRAWPLRISSNGWLPWSRDLLCGGLAASEHRVCGWQAPPSSVVGSRERVGSEGVEVRLRVAGSPSRILFLGDG